MADRSLGFSSAAAADRLQIDLEQQQTAEYGAAAADRWQIELEQIEQELLV